MQNIPQSPFLFFWHNTMIIGSITMLITAVVIYIMHNLKVSSIKDLKERYDYANQKEIKNYKIVFLCLGISTMLIINIYGIGKIFEVELWFFVRLFISVAGGTLVSYVAFLILDYYYPTLLDKKLRKWRYTPRVNSKTGNPMRLLGEEEEDVHLEQGMQAEENIFSIDYDVWIDEKSGDVKIEKYAGHLQASKCNSCGFHTMKVVKEEITEQPTAEAPGELIKHYQCSYCKSVRATAFKISTKEIDDYKSATLHSFRRNKNIELIRLEIHFNTLGKKFFEFQNIEQAQKFLSEYDSEKVV
jgi:hypothetical protein